MKNHQPTKDRKRDQKYTETDSRQFEHLMQSTHRTTNLKNEPVRPGRLNNSFEYSDTDSKLFESLSAPLAKYRRTIAGPGRTNRDNGYSENDQQLFDSLLPELNAVGNQGSPAVKNTSHSSRHQEYSEADLKKFRILAPGLPDDTHDSETDGFLAPSPRDRDVGKMKVKTFDSPGFDRSTDTIGHSNTGQSTIKVKYFD